MFPWLAQVEILSGTGNRNLLIVALGLALILVLLLLLLLLRVRRRNRANRPDALQSRLQDIAPPPAEAQPLPRTPAPARTEITPEVGLSPIEQKLKELEAEEAGQQNTGRQAADDFDIDQEWMTEQDYYRMTIQAQSRAAQEEVEQPPAIPPEEDDFDLELGPAGSALFWGEQGDDAAIFDDPDVEFEPGEDLSFLFAEDVGEMEPEPEPEPPPPLTVLQDIDARSFLEQVNQYTLRNAGTIEDSPGELHLAWPGPAGMHRITIAAVDQETLMINGQSFPASPEGVKQGIVATLKNKNY